MGLVIQQSIKGAIWNYLGIALGAVNVLWVFPYFLSKEEIGIYRVVVDIAGLFALFASLGSSLIADRFYTRVPEGKRAGFNLYTWLVALLGFTIFAIVYYFYSDFFFRLFTENSAKVSNYALFILILCLALIFQNLCESMFRVKLNIVTPAFFREVFLRIVALLTCLFLGYRWITFDSMMDLIMLSYWAVVVLLLLIYIRQWRKEKIPFSFYWPDKQVLKQIVSYGGMILIAGGSAILISRIDVLMIAIMLENGLDQVAVYALGFFIASVIEVPRKSISQIASPLLSSAWHRNDLAYIQDMYKRSAINLLLIGGSIFMLIWISIDDLITIIPNYTIYAECRMVFLWIGLSRLVNMMVGLGGEILLQSKYYRFNVVSLFVLVILVVAFNYWFIPIKGIEGAAIGTFLALVLYNLLKTAFIYFKMGMQPFTNGMLKILVVGLAFFAPFIWLNQVWQAEGWISAILLIGIKSALFLVPTLLVLYKWKVSSEMNQVIERGLSFILQRFRRE